MGTTAEAIGRTWAGYLLGFALGGFFDGILLHQILQWHHLLLGVDAEALQDIRVQILADGLFHLLMYGIALVGLWALWRAHRQGIVPSGRRLLGDALIGFGAWHIMDALVAHWLLGIHRIKMDSPNLLLWDLVWLAAFGVAPAVAGVLLRSSTRGGPAGGSPAAAALSMAALLGGPLAALPPRDADQVAVLVRPAEANRLLDGLQRIDGAILWADRSGALWVFRVNAADEAAALYAHGALLVTASPAALGCLAWTRTG